MADQIYKVRDPGGAIREIKGPEGATDEEVIAQAQKLFAVSEPVRPAPPKELTTGQKLATGALQGMMGGPVGALIGAGKAASDIGNEALGKIAYDVGGKVTDVTGSPALGYAANVATQAVPTYTGGKMVGMLSSPAMKSGAASLMQRAFKPSSKELASGQADRAIQTMLDEGISATRGGMEKLSDKITSVNDKITEAIARSAATVDKGQVASRIGDRVSVIERTNPTPQDALAQTEKVYNDFLSNHLVPDNIPVQRAQELKRGIYQVLRDSYGEHGSNTVEAQKALARGFKELIAKAVPEISALNAREGDLLNALKVAEKKVLVRGNKNVLGLTPLTPNPISALTFMLDRSPAVQSTLARGMYSGSERIPQALATGGLLGAGAMDQDNTGGLLSPWIR